MHASRFTRLVATITTLAAATAPLHAGGRAAECYEYYSKPPVYGAVTEHVQVHPGYMHVETTPPIIGTATRQVQVLPQRIVQRRTPATYRYVEETVQVAPARTVKRLAPARVVTRYRTVKVDGGYGWEWRVIKGKRVLCKVKLGPRFKKVSYQLEVAPAKWVHERVPARYATKTRKVLVAPGGTENYVLAPEYETELAQVVIQPKQVRHYKVAPAYTTKTRTMMVEPGREGWKPMRPRCR